jgi:hypothetical protein
MFFRKVVVEALHHRLHVLLLSFQLKCSLNIDSIHYLGLTNSFDRKLINFLLLLNEPIRFRFRTDLPIGNAQEVKKIRIRMNWSARGNVLNQYLRNTSIGTTVNGECQLER